MRFRSRVVLAVCFAAWTTLVADARAQTAESDARYQTTIEQAVREFSLSNWAEARALFRRAHVLSPSARTLRGMGMAAFEQKLYVDALRELQAALADTQRPLTPDQRAQVQSLIDQSRAYVGRYQITLEPPTAQLTVDGRPAVLDPGNVLLLALGNRLVRASAEGHQSIEVPLRVQGGEDLALRIALNPDAPAATPEPAAEPEPAASESPATPPALPPPAFPADSAATQGGAGLGTAAWITLGGAAAFGGAALAFWIIGDGQYDDLENSCATRCSDAQIADSGVETSDLLTTVFLSVSAAAAVTSVVLFVLDGQRAEPASAGQAQLRITPAGAVLQGSF